MISNILRNIIATESMAYAGLVKCYALISPRFKYDHDYQRLLNGSINEITTLPLISEKIFICVASYLFQHMQYSRRMVF